MTLKQALLSGCALALLTFEAQAQEQETATPPAQPQAAAPAAEAEGRTLKGTVVDRLTREGVPLARVIIKGTRRGVETEVDGTFSLTIPTGPVTLHISSQDHKAREVTVNADQAELTIPMEASFVEELVVVGRASELARKHLANSVASVKGEDLTRAPAATVDQALQGKVAGANIQSNSGAPGGGMQMRLRGVSSINGESNPLYVVDGVIISDVAIASGVFAVTASIGGSNPNPTQDNQVNRIADLNPNDIESIEVLKGASAAAIYGSKASNGVVIITTKRGRSGEPRVELTQRVGVYALANKLGSRRFETLDEAVKQFDPKGEFDPGMETYYTPGAYFDHEQLVAGRTDLSTETLANVSGQAGNTRYFVSGTVKNDEGIVTNTGYEKQSLRVNVTQKLSEALEVNITTNLLHTLGQRGLTNNDNAGVTTGMVLPFMPSFWDARADADGNYPANPFIGSRANALQTQALMRNDEDVWRFIGSADATLSAYKTDTQELRVLGNVGVDRFQQKNELVFPPALHFELEDDKLPGTSLFATSEVLNLNTGLNVVHTLRPMPGVTATTSAGFQFEQRNLDSTYIVGRYLNAGQPNVDSATQVSLRQPKQLVRDRGLYLQEEALLLDERLTLVGSLRAEQSSNNGNPYQPFFYPKLATAYRLPQLLPFANELKLRVAYGETGNLPLYNRKFSPMLSKGHIEGNPGLIFSGIAGNPNIVPERQREIEAGVDALLFNGDAVVELTVYQRTINDMLLQVATAPSTGYNTQYINGGELRNRGVEVMLQLTPVHDSNFEWVSNTTFALNRSEVTDLPVPSFLAGGFGVGLGAFRIQEGQSATQIVGNTLKADGTCCMEAKIGDAEPDFRMSFANTLRYQQFSLSFLLDWQQGSDVINLTRFIYDLAGTSADYEEAGQQRLKDQATNTAVYVEDASFLKLREVTLSYQLPESFVRGLPKVRSARISLSGRNLLTFTRYSGLDPEVSNFGNQSIARNIDVAPFPPSRSFWTSIDLGF